jgi:hypothetical protein
MGRVSDAVRGVAAGCVFEGSSAVVVGGRFCLRSVALRCGGACGAVAAGSACCGLCGVPVGSLVRPFRWASAASTVGISFWR